MTDKWNGLAVLLANLIEKYAADLDIDSLPDPVLMEQKSDESNADEIVYKEDIEIRKAA